MVGWFVRSLSTTIWRSRSVRMTSCINYIFVSGNYTYSRVEEVYQKYNYKRERERAASTSSGTLL